MTDRNKNWPGKATQDEITAINNLAREAGLSPSNYLRQCLGLPIVEMGPPKGNQNATIKPKPHKSRSRS